MAFCDADKSVRICSEVEITYVQFKSMDIYRRCISSRASILKMQALLFFLPCGLFEKIFPLLFLPSPVLTDCYSSHSVQFAHYLLQPSKTWSTISVSWVMQNKYCIALHCISFYWRKIFCFTCYYSTSSQHCFSYVLDTYLFKE